MARKRMIRKQKNVVPKMQLSFINQYNALLMVKIRHDFFRSGNFNSINIRPTNATLEILQRNSMQFRKEASGFTIGYASTELFSPVKDLRKPMQLSFLLEVSDPCLYNYTDLPFSFDDTIYYFNNKGLEKDTTEYKNLSLDQYVTGEDKIDITAPLLQHDFDEPQEGTEIQIIDACETVVYEEEITDGRVTTEIDLSLEPDGKYTLLIDGLEEYSFYLTRALRKVFGAIDIVIDKNEIGEYTFFDDNGEVVMQEYNIHFKNRSVRWKYMIVETTQQKLHKEHKVTDVTKGGEHQVVDFLPVEEEQLDNGEIVQAIWSETPIPFKERQTEQFKLKTKRGRSGVDWITDLPFASSKSDLKVNFLDKDEIYSELFVYL